jgi:hypothetical protein
MTPVFLPRYPEPRKVPTNPCWFPYAKGSSREGQAPRSSNSVESSGPSPHASGPTLAATLIRFRLKRRGPRSYRYTVASVTQTRLSQSRKTLAHLVQLQRLTQESRGFVGFSKLTQLTRIHLEQAYKRSN